MNINDVTLCFVYNCLLHSVKTSIYLCLLYLLGHRLLTKVRHSSLFWALLSSWLQVCPIPLISLARSPCQMLHGPSRDHFPWGFHVSACLVMLVSNLQSVLPIHLHLLWSISSCNWCLTGCWWRQASESSESFWGNHWQRPGLAWGWLLLSSKCLRTSIWVHMLKFM